MKKLRNIIIIFLLLILGGGIFFLGWIQIHLEENTYAVAFTKSGGYLDEVFSPGTFSWSIHRLIPGNFKLIKFKLVPQTLSFSRYSTLPSGDVYGRFMTGQPDFSYSLSFSASYTIIETYLPSLLKDSRLAPESLDTFYASLKNELSSSISSIILDKAESFKDSLSLDYLSADFYGIVKEKLKDSFPFVKINSLAVTQLDFPDAALYRKARENYFNYIAAKNSIDTEARQKAAEDEIKEASKIELLTKYGELLKKYPELVQVLASNSSIRSDVLPSISFSGVSENE